MKTSNKTKLQRSFSQPTRSTSTKPKDSSKSPNTTTIKKKIVITRGKVEKPKDEHFLANVGNDPKIQLNPQIEVPNSDSTSAKTASTSKDWKGISNKGEKYVYCRECKTDVAKSGIYGPKGHPETESHKLNIRLNSKLCVNAKINPKDPTKPPDMIEEEESDPMEWKIKQFEYKLVQFVVNNNLPLTAIESIHSFMRENIKTTNDVSVLSGSTMHRCFRYIELLL